MSEASATSQTAIRDITGKAGRPSALIFDWDNTLVDSWGIIHRALVDTFKAFGKAPWTLEESKANVRKSARDSFPILFGDEWEAAKDHYIAAFEAVHLDELTLLDGAQNLVEAAAAAMPLAIVSNKTGRLLRAEIEHLGWGSHFVAALGAGDAEADKPDPTPVRIVRKKLSEAQNTNVWFLGDADVDMACAQNSNCAGVLIHGTSLGQFFNRAVPPGTDLAVLDLPTLQAHLRDGDAM
ncbi:MAG: HAD hydrolase-like protein [Alphaproteobacteria bacterium]|nr:HAD hydrolase-like protein [Alphaproteobacteria bacterium SS10]